MVVSTLRILAMLLLVAAWGAPQARAQFSWPEHPENLEVLPEDITPAQLSAVMRSFARGLGVRCQHCHVGEEGMPLEEFDFVSDDKPAKETARLMLRMVQAVNADYISQVEKEEGSPLEVTCITCHRGQPRPILLEDLLAEMLPAHGVEATVEEYRDLREQYYGGFSYDFGERTLIRLGEQLVEEEKYDQALAILELNAEHFPTSATTWFVMGEALAAKGDKEAAIEAFEETLRLNARFTPAQRRLEELRQE